MDSTDIIPQGENIVCTLGDISKATEKKKKAGVSIITDDKVYFYGNCVYLGSDGRFRKKTLKEVQSIPLTDVNNITTKTTIGSFAVSIIIGILALMAFISALGEGAYDTQSSQDMIWVFLLYVGAPVVPFLYLPFHNKRHYMFINYASNNIGLKINDYTLEDIEIYKQALLGQTKEALKNNLDIEDCIRDKDVIAVLEQHEEKRFALTDKYLYISGHCAYQNLNKDIKEQTIHGTKIIEIDKITDAEVRRRPLQIMVVLSIIALEILNFFILVGILSEFPEGYTWKDYISELLRTPSMYFWVPALVAIIVTILTIKKYFRIDYGDGNIGFNVKDYDKNKVEEFERLLNHARGKDGNKQTAFSSMDYQQETPVTPVEQTAMSQSVTDGKGTAEVLREYAKLKEDGIISEEEFQQMKAKLLSQQ